MSIIMRVVDIKNSIALVQYDDKLLKYVRTDQLSEELIAAFRKEKASESQVEGGRYK